MEPQGHGRHDKAGQSSQSGWRFILRVEMMPHRILDWLSQSPVLRASDAVTIPAGVTFPIWWPLFRDWSWTTLNGASNAATLLVPILTVLLLIIRIVLSFRGKSQDDG